MEHFSSAVVRAFCSLPLPYLPCRQITAITRVIYHFPNCLCASPLPPFSAPLTPVSSTIYKSDTLLRYLNTAFLINRLNSVFFDLLQRSRETSRHSYFRPLPFQVRINVIQYFVFRILRRACVLSGIDVLPEQNKVSTFRWEKTQME